MLTPTIPSPRTSNHPTPLPTPHPVPASLHLSLTPSYPSSLLPSPSHLPSPVSCIAFYPPQYPRPRITCIVRAGVSDPLTPPPRHPRLTHDLQAPALADHSLRDSTAPLPALASALTSFPRPFSYLTYPLHSLYFSIHYIVVGFLIVSTSQILFFFSSTHLPVLKLPFPLSCLPFLFIYIPLSLFLFSHFLLPVLCLYISFSFPSFLYIYFFLSVSISPLPISFVFFSFSLHASTSLLFSHPFY